MKKILSAIVLATSVAIPALAALDPDCVLYYDFETMADEYQVENIANPGVMQLDGKRLSLANVVEATPSAKIRQTPDARGYSRRRFLPYAPLCTGRGGV